MLEPKEDRVIPLELTEGVANVLVTRRGDTARGTSEEVGIPLRGSGPFAKPRSWLVQCAGDLFGYQRQKIVRFLERLNSPLVFVVVVAVFLILDGFLLYRYQQSLQSTAGSASNVPVEETSSSLKLETRPAEETTSSTKASSTLAEETTSSSKEAGGVRVLVEVASIGVGLSILEDGQLVYDQVTSSGFSEEFEAEQNVTVTVADAGLVQVGVNGGNPRPLGASGEQVTRIFTPED